MIRECLLHVMLMAAAAPACDAEPAFATDTPLARPGFTPHPTLLTDVAVVGGVTGLVTVLNPDVRAGVFGRGSLGHVLENFRHPIRRSLQGGREDDDAFFHNYVGHPLSWGILGFYLRERGYSRRSSLLFSQVHSVTWEFVVEGSFQKPSGKDLLTNLSSSAVAIYVLHGWLGRRWDAEREPGPRLSLLLEPLALPDLSSGQGPRAAAPGGLAVGLALSW